VSAIVVDTSTWISYFKNTDMPEINEALQDGGVFIPSVVISELLSAKLSARDHSKLVDFLYDLRPCTVDFKHWVRVGELRRELSKKGIHVSTPDAHIAQAAIDQNATLLSEDKIFRLVQKHSKLKLSKPI
jgi:predicted nucleic acid-binding protein